MFQKETLKTHDKWKPDIVSWVIYNFEQKQLWNLSQNLWVFDLISKKQVLNFAKNLLSSFIHKSNVYKSFT